MIRYTEWLEQNNVYRIDQDKIGNFSSKLRSYHRNSDWTSSGTFDKESDVPSDWTKETGLFAGDLKDVIPYAVPRDVKWIVTHENPKRPTVIFNQLDKTRIISHRPYLSQFPSSWFEICITNRQRDDSRFSNLFICFWQHG